MPLIMDAILDLALAGIDDQATALHICTADPTTFSIATTEGTSMCGVKTTPTIGVPENGASNGRRVIVAEITDGSVTCTGTVTASHWALVSGSVLLASGALSATQSVTDLNVFTLDAFSITIADAT